ncbi:MAG TPA: 16S rRNA (adenine(1518)-N(6)/adenine(1519)-N(6))-dimethyltransferase RsmA [Acidimicrobiia bacterium]|nr:16S rRNA (adenine(1518)-N(6)/adenine(1519)-N(6))-dimethyltransferase RsmA [Acidimicrobiia bacterium]
MTPLLTPSSIRALLDAHGLHPSRALGQNFLADPNTARRIVRLAAVDGRTPVVEVGPGVGSLTLALCEAGAAVTAIELDRHVVAALEETVAGLPVTIVHDDALTIDWRNVLAAAPRWVMVSNLPYNVATPVVVHVLERAPMVERLLVMVQREVGERLAARVGDSAYGAVSVKVAYYSEARVVGVVPPTVFVPKPKVESALVALTRRESPPVDVPDVDRLFELVRAGFATRRKTLRNALATVLGNRAVPRLEGAGIDPGARAETVGLDGWARLARADAEDRA